MAETLGFSVLLMEVKLLKVLGKHIEHWVLGPLVRANVLAKMNEIFSWVASSLGIVSFWPPAVCPVSLRSVDRQTHA